MLKFEEILKQFQENNAGYMNFEDLYKYLCLTSSEKLNSIMQL
jgi:hypothetical protein